MAPLRAAAALLAATFTVIVAVPCPEVEASCNQALSLRADQVQSRSAEMDSRVFPGSGGSVADSAVIDALHRTAPGPPETSVTEVEPHARVSVASARAKAAPIDLPGVPRPYG